MSLLLQKLERAADSARDFIRGMDWFRGLRAGFALSMPMLVGDLTGNSLMLGWSALGGFESILADPGGPYRTRLKGLSLITLGGSLGVALGTLAGVHWSLAVGVTLLFCFVWSYLGVLGPPFTTASILVQVIYFCGLGFPAASTHEVLLRALYLLGGGLWAMALSLFLWPVDPYRPARFAVGACYEELSAFLNAIQELNRNREKNPEAWHAVEQRHQNAMRRLLETGWHAAAGVATLARTQSARGKSIVVLLESADLLLARTVALAQYLEMTSGQDSSPCTVRGKSALLELARIESWIATLLRRRLSNIEEAAQNNRMRLNRMPAELAQCMASDDTAGQFLLHQLSDAAQNIETALECAVAIRQGRQPEEAMLQKRTRRESGGLRQFALRRSRLLDALVANWNWKSLMLRHSVRVALVCGVDIALLRWWRIDHGYWLPLTSLIVLQPHVSGTFRRGLQRVAGTVGGGIFAAVLAVYLHSPILTAAALFPLALVAVGTLPVSYTIFSFFVTPTFVLAFLPYDGDWQLAFIRVLNTVLGAAIAMIAMAALFPTLEKNRVAMALTRSLEANRRYAEELALGWQRGVSRQGDPSLAHARRATGLSHNDTEESLERVIAESFQRNAEATEAAIAFVTYLRRFGSSITGLASMGGEEEWKRSRVVQLRLSRIEQQLIQMEQALGAPAAEGQSWITEEEIEAAALENEYGILSDPMKQNGERQLARLERQATVLARQLLTMQKNGLGVSAAQSKDAVLEKI
jgi:uncharacterized membrane protein YccC